MSDLHLPEPDEDVAIHVYNGTEASYHNTDSPECQCHPRIEHYPEGDVIIHNRLVQ